MKLELGSNSLTSTTQGITLIARSGTHESPASFVPPRRPPHSPQILLDADEKGPPIRLNLVCTQIIVRTVFTILQFHEKVWALRTLIMQHNIMSMKRAFHESRSKIGGVYFTMEVLILMLLVL